MRKTNWLFFLYIVLIAGLFPEKSYAYIDPGTGSYLFQIIIATLLTLLFTFKNIFRTVSEFFRRFFSKKSGPR